MLEHIDIPRQELYDGLEDGFWEQTFTLPVDGISFSVTDLPGSFSSGLRAQVGDAAFEQVIADAGIRRSQGVYQSADGLPLDYLARGGCVFVFGIGERSAGRYQINLEGAWRMA